MSNYSTPQLRKSVIALDGLREFGGRPEVLDQLGITRATAQRFWSHVDVTENGCWIWRDYVDDDGYGVCTIGDRKSVV